LSHKSVKETLNVKEQQTHKQQKVESKVEKMKGESLYTL